MAHVEQTCVEVMFFDKTPSWETDSATFSGCTGESLGDRILVSVQINKAVATTDDRATVCANSSRANGRVATSVPQERIVELCARTVDVLHELW